MKRLFLCLLLAASGAAHAQQVELLDWDGEILTLLVNGERYTSVPQADWLAAGDIAARDSAREVRLSDIAAALATTELRADSLQSSVLLLDANNEQLRLSIGLERDIADTTIAGLRSDVRALQRRAWIERGAWASGAAVILYLSLR